MFGAISAEVSDRVAQAAAMVRSITEAEAPGGSGALQNTRAAKGLVFVLLYAAYEYCVVQSFQAALRALNAHRVPLQNLCAATLSLAMDDECRSLRDTTIKKGWKGRAALFQRSRLLTPAFIKDNLFPWDDSHMREGQLQTVWAVLGISTPTTPHPRFFGRIQELVENRNAIAHGRERSDAIGRRYSVKDLDDRVRDVGELCQYIISTLQSHCADSANFR